MPSPRSVTADYERWLGEQIPVVAADLERKHEEMARDEYRFFRGTYYLWLLRAADHVPEAFGHTAVPLVGDLHVENYGTWRDRSGIRRWGVNDLDELAAGSWLLDPLRLATSAVLAPHVHLSAHEICDTVLETWYAATPGRAVALDDAPRLGRLLPEPRAAGAFYDDLRSGPEVDDVPAAVRTAVVGSAEPGWQPEWHAREAGTGSLGHRRRVGLGRDSEGAWLAREVKELGPPTCVWSARDSSHVSWPQPDPALYGVVVAAVRASAFAVRADGWQVRELAPDVLRVEPAHLRDHDARTVLEAMARASTDVAGCGRKAWERARDEKVSTHDFRDLVATMVGVVRDDFAAYR